MYPRIQTGLDLHLQNESPALGKGKISIPGIPMFAVTSGANIAQPNIDIGAYPSDGSGNQH